MIQMAMGMAQKNTSVPIPRRVLPRKTSSAPAESPMANIIPGHHQPVYSNTPRLMRKIPPEMVLALRFFSFFTSFGYDSVVISFSSLLSPKHSGLEAGPEHDIYFSPR